VELARTRDGRDRPREAERRVREGRQADRRASDRGRPEEPGVTVTKHGFSQRFRSGLSTVGYGIVLTNTAADRDALDVIVLTNFVDATNTVLGTDTRLISGIPAGAPYCMGDYASLPAIQVERLEITVQVQSRAPRTIHEQYSVKVTNDRDGVLLTSSR
jgi:hypothetical protein